MKQHFIAKDINLLNLSLSVTAIRVVKVRLSLLWPYVTKSKGSHPSPCEPKN